MTSDIDGFYSAYFTGVAGSGFAVLVLRNLVLCGSDAVGAIYDGSYSKNMENGKIKINTSIKLPPLSFTVQGQTVGEDGLIQNLSFEADLGDDVPYFTIETSTGPVNAKFTKIRDITI